jgi:hypothetical protein
MAETGLNYNNRRDYDPATRRYVEPDPVGLAGGSYSTYGYVASDPISLIDPFGLYPAVTLTLPDGTQYVPVTMLRIWHRRDRNANGEVEGPHRSARGAKPQAHHGPLQRLLGIRPRRTGGVEADDDVATGLKDFLPDRCLVFDDLRIFTCQRGETPARPFPADWKVIRFACDGAKHNEVPVHPPVRNNMVRQLGEAPAPQEQIDVAPKHCARQVNRGVMRRIFTRGRHAEFPDA